MKRTILTLCFVSLFLLGNAQFFNPYMQLEAGMAVNNKKTGILWAEIGTTYKWLDIALAADYVSNGFWKEYNGTISIKRDEGYNPALNLNENFGYFTKTSLQLVAKIDIVRLFTENSRHCFKVGGGYGILHSRSSKSSDNFSEAQNIKYLLSTESRLNLLGSFKVSYEYKVKPSVNVGAFFGGTYYPGVGLLLRANL